MRVIQVEVVARYDADARQSGLAFDLPQYALVQEIRALETQISELVRDRANACLAKDHQVFVRTHLGSAAARTVTDLWIVAPKARGPYGLLTRSTWKLLAPMLAQSVRELSAAWFKSVAVDVDPRLTEITALTPMRLWRDHLILSAMTIMLTNMAWLYFYDVIKPWLHLAQRRRTVGRLDRPIGIGVKRPPFATLMRAAILAPKRHRVFGVDESVAIWCMVRRQP